MPGVARQGDSVNTVHGAGGGKNCNAAAQTTSTSGASDNVFVNSLAVVRKDDVVTAHNNGLACVTHAPGLVVCSDTVFVNDKGMGRINDTYECGAQIISGSADVICD